MLKLLTSFLLTGCALLPGATIVSVGGGAEERVPVQVQQVMGVSWSQSATYEDVSILAPIGGDCGFDGRSAGGFLYLTTAVGPDTTRENVLGSASLFGRPSGMNTILTGLTLPPG